MNLIKVFFKKLELLFRSESFNNELAKEMAFYQEQTVNPVEALRAE